MANKNLDILQTEKILNGSEFVTKFEDLWQSLKSNFSSTHSDFVESKKNCKLNF